MAELSAAAQSHAQSGAEPRGGRIGVAFDWGFGIQIASQGLANLVGLPQPGGAAPNPVVGAVTVGVALLVFAQGEALRRGNGIARRIQIFANSALTLAGVGLLAGLVGKIVQGQFGPGQVPQLYSLLLLLVVSPLEVWLLLQPGSRQWYGHVSAAEGRARHNGAWLTGTVAWAVVGGLLQTMAVYLQ